MNIEEAFLDKIWLVVNDGLPEGELMLSGNDQDKVETILEEYHQAKLKNLSLSGVSKSFVCTYCGINTLIDTCQQPKKCSSKEKIPAN
jgi:hypothetical protein